MVSDEAMMTNLTHLLLLLIPVWLMIRVGAIDSTETDTDPNESDRAKGAPKGGLRWSNLGVSFDACDATSEDVDCSEDSMWLLHPSSGFVENGSLCGILGPSGRITFLALFTCISSLSLMCMYFMIIRCWKDNISQCSWRSNFQ